MVVAFVVQSNVIVRVVIWDVRVDSASVEMHSADFLHKSATIGAWIKASTAVSRRNVLYVFLSNIRADNGYSHRSSSSSRTLLSNLLHLR